MHSHGEYPPAIVKYHIRVNWAGDMRVRAYHSEYAGDMRWMRLVI